MAVEKKASTTAGNRVNGRKKLDRDERLEQMRQAQAKLKEKRASELNRLRYERDQLKNQVERLQKEMDSALIFQNDSLRKHRNADAVCELPSPPLSVQFGPPALEGKYDIAAKVVSQSLHCIDMYMKEGNAYLLKQTVFRFTPASGVNDYLVKLSSVQTQTASEVSYLRVPQSMLPKGVMSLLEACEFVDRHIPVHAADLDLLVQLITRSCFATSWGPCVFISDVMSSATVAMSNNQLRPPVLCLDDYQSSSRAASTVG